MTYRIKSDYGMKKLFLLFIAGISSAISLNTMDQDYLSSLSEEDRIAIQEALCGDESVVDSGGGDIIDFPSAPARPNSPVEARLISWGGELHDMQDVTDDNIVIDATDWLRRRNVVPERLKMLSMGGDNSLDMHDMHVCDQCKLNTKNGGRLWHLWSRIGEQRIICDGCHQFVRGRIAPNGFPKVCLFDEEVEKFESSLDYKFLKAKKISI